MHVFYFGWGTKEYREQYYKVQYWD